MENGKGNKGVEDDVKVELSPAMQNTLRALNGFTEIQNELFEEGQKEGLIKVIDSKNPDTGAQEKPVEKPVEEKKPTEVAAAEKKEEGAGAAAEKEIEEEEEEPDPILGKATKKKNADASVKFETLEDAAKYAKKKFGIEIKGVGDLAVLFNSSETWRTDATKYSDAKKTNEKYDLLFKKMPDYMIRSMQAYFTGGDHVAEFNKRPAFDFSKAAEKQDEKSLLNHFYPGKYKEEDFADEAKAAEIAIAIDASKTKYGVLKSTWEGERAKLYNDEVAKLDAMKNSVAGSVTSLQQSFPDLPEKTQVEIKAIMEGGDVESLFKNTDGTYKPEAAEMLMLAKFGKQTMQRLMKQAAQQGESRANEDTLTRGADKPTPHKGGAHEKPNEKVVKKITQMTGGLLKKNFY